MKKALLADDSASLVYMVSSILKDGGYEVTAVSNGQTAFRRMMGTRYDVLVTDLSMPEMNGLELIRAVRNSNAYLPIVVLSGIENIDTAVDAMREGADDFVRKKTEDLAKTLLFVLERAIKRKKSEKKLEIYESILPICMHCKKIRDKSENTPEAWVSVEEYFERKKSGIDFSHGICPECMKKYYPDLT